MKKIAMIISASALFTGTAMADGKAVFEAEKCTKCHAVPSQKIESTKKDEAVELPGAMGTHDAAFFKGWLKKEIEIDSNVKKGQKTKHKKGWEGNDADLDTLANWLVTLK